MTKGTPEDPDTPRNQTPSAGSSERLMNSQEVMDFIGVSRTRLWQLVKNHGLPAYQFGAKGDYRYRRSEIEAWLKGFKVKQPPNPPGST